MNKDLIGFGSFFHKTNLDELPDIPTRFLKDYQLFYAGRYAMKYVFDMLIKNYDIGHIWLPQYYCPFVKEWLEKGFPNLKYYDIDPFDPEAQVDYSQFSTNDVVLVNNYWGLKRNDIPTGKRPLIGEDHSHGWLSPGCLQSEADFCIASLRKTVPLPLGGIAWKPKKSKAALSLPQLSTSAENTGMEHAWDLVDKAMALKASCTSVEEKTQFLDLYGNGENVLRTTQELKTLRPNHEKVLTEALFKDYNSHKIKNWEYVTTKINENSSFKVLPKGEATPFGLLLVFKEYEDLKLMKQHLISKSIYPAELWPQNNIRYEYKFLLNIHIDFRYEARDMDYFAATINQWTQ